MAGGLTQEGKTQRLQLSFFAFPTLSLAQKNAGFPRKWTPLEKVTQEREQRLRTRKKRINIPQVDGWDMATAEINPRKSHNCGGSCVVPATSTEEKREHYQKFRNSAKFRAFPQKSRNRAILQKRVVFLKEITNSGIPPNSVPVLFFPHAEAAIFC